jgi:hypothetical protein
VAIQFGPRMLPVRPASASHVTVETPNREPVELTSPVSLDDQGRVTFSVAGPGTYRIGVKSPFGTGELFAVEVPVYDTGHPNEKYDNLVSGLLDDPTSQLRDKLDARIIALAGEGVEASWDTLPDKPAVVAAGETVAEALDAIGAVPAIRTINSKTLVDNVVLSAADLELTGYVGGASGAVSPEDTINEAIAKLGTSITVNSSTVLLRGDGIDTTGETDTTAAVQAKIAANAGKVIQVGGGDVLQLSAQLQIPADTTLVGPGELRFVGGFVHNGAVRLSHNTRLVDVKITNPNQIISGNTGGRSYGVTVLGNNVLVQGNIVDNFENGIAVLSGGEYYGTKIIGNTVSNVVGWNSVPSNNGTTGGEDRGDGIVTWGALTTIVGNVVYVKPGYDARIGIHAESLKSEDDTASAHDDRMVTITGNVVWGKFRRGITVEETKQAVVTGNTVADATWWGISMILGEGHVVQGNTIRWTRTSSDTQGSNYSPTRGPIAIIKGSLGTIVQGNTLVIADGASAAGAVMLYSQGADDQPVDCMILDNNIQVLGTGTLQDGIRSDGLNFTRPVIRGNFISGFSRHGINMYTVDSPVVESNIIRGSSATSGYTKQNGGGDFGICRFNVISGAGIGIQAASVANNGLIENNYINTAQAFFFNGTPTGNRLASNKFGPLVTTYSFPNATNNFLFNNMELQAASAWEPGVIAAGASVSTTFTLTGAAVGNSNLCLVGAPYDLKGLTATAHVSAPNTVRIVVANLTGAEQTLGSGTWKVQILGR